MCFTFYGLKSFLMWDSCCEFSALIRHNKLGIAAFRLANGFSALRDALVSDSVRFQRYVVLYFVILQAILLF